MLLVVVLPPAKKYGWGQVRGYCHGMEEAVDEAGEAGDGGIEEAGVL